MIKSIHFKNVKALRDATLPLEPVTVLLGPNGSGKSTVLECITALQRNGETTLTSPVASLDSSGNPTVSFDFGDDTPKAIASYERAYTGKLAFSIRDLDANKPYELPFSIERYSFNTAVAGEELTLSPSPSLSSTGDNLVNVFQHLKDDQDERDNDAFDRVNNALRSWLPEYSRIALRQGRPGKRTLWLRLAKEDQSLPVHALSDGTRLSLCLLGVAYQQSPPSVICLEEPDQGLHPRLLGLLRDAIYHLAYPKEHGEDRKPTQVILTTHNPYFVDEFKERPEQVVLAKKEGLNVTFERLSDRPGLQEMLYNISLGEAWYTGFLGGVPAAQ